MTFKVFLEISLAVQDESCQKCQNILMLGFIGSRPQQSSKPKNNGGRDSVACAKFRLESVYAFEEAKMDIYRIFFQKM